MSNVKLNSADLKHLINRYEADLRQLHFQMESTRRILHDLREALPAIEADELAQTANIAEAPSPLADILSDAKPARGRGGRKATKAKTTGRKRGPKPGAKKKAAPKAKASAEKPSGYRLSEIDQLIMEALEARGKALINSEMQEYVEAKKQAAGEKVDSDDISIKISRSLQKLANRRKDLIKVPYDGRGKAYAMPSWVNPDGTTKKKYAR
ncbi:MAG: hypothetical protein KDC54_12740 [Lewinella sp.]|nr:hypothetical protein [Lewinella sp.]